MLRKALLLALVVLAPWAARAGHDVVRTLDFLGFSADGSKYLLKVSDANFGDFLSLRSFDTGKQVKSYKIEDKKDEKRLTEQAIKENKITDKGKDSQASPDGRYTIIGIPKGENFLLNVGKGERVAKWQSIKVESDRTSQAKVTLKSVFWDQSGRRVVVLVHKKLVGDNGMDADEAYPYEFYPGELTFK